LIAVQSVTLFQISSLLTERAQAKQYETLLEGLEHEKKQLQAKVGEMQKTAAQSQLNANNDGKSTVLDTINILYVLFKSLTKRI